MRAPPTIGPVPGQELEHVARHPRLIQEADGHRGDQRCGFSRLGDDAVAGGKGCRDLAGENGEREIPGRNAAYDAAGLTDLRRRVRFGRVITKKINGLSEFSDMQSSKVLPASRAASAKKAPCMGFVKIGSTVQDGGNGRMPAGLGQAAGSSQGSGDVGLGGFDHLADEVVLIGPDYGSFGDEHRLSTGPAIIGAICQVSESERRSRAASISARC